MTEQSCFWGVDNYVNFAHNFHCICLFCLFCKTRCLMDMSCTYLGRDSQEKKLVEKLFEMET